MFRVSTYGYGLGSRGVQGERGEAWRRDEARRGEGEASKSGDAVPGNRAEDGTGQPL